MTYADALQQPGRVLAGYGITAKPTSEGSTFTLSKKDWKGNLDVSQEGLISIALFMEWHGLPETDDTEDADEN